MHCLNCIRCMQNSTFETGLTHSAYGLNANFKSYILSLFIYLETDCFYRRWKTLQKSCTSFVEPPILYFRLDISLMQVLERVLIRKSVFKYYLFLRTLHFSVKKEKETLLAWYLETEQPAENRCPFALRGWSLFLKTQSQAIHDD